MMTTSTVIIYQVMNMTSMGITSLWLVPEYSFLKTLNILLHLLKGAGFFVILHTYNSKPLEYG